MITTMPTDPILILSQWFSPAYPLGSFAYSHGLEVAIQEGGISTAAQLELWLGDLLHHGTGHTDAIFVHVAHSCDDLARVEVLDAQARAFSPSAERLFESAQQGSAFARTTRDIWGVDLPDLLHPVSVGYAARLLDLPAGLTATLYLQAFVANLVSCAVRLVPLGQTEGQAVLRRLSLLCPQISAEASDEGMEGLLSATFASDIAAMRHETLNHRIFRT
ncbi:urease accessory protein UreF [Sulfitobacter sp.]|uniref:urease accessory protein UreF n=1 Tax=Sulfitobacter sp. TaxID=1903071 RepID=UPI00300384D8